MKELFKKTRQDMVDYGRILEAVGAMAVKLGVPAEGLNVSNAWAKVKTSLNQYLSLEAKAKEMGYSSLPIALKALGQIKQQGEEGWENLPDQLKKVPAIWLTGRPARKRKDPDAFPGMSPREAERIYRRMKGDLIEAWTLIENEPWQQEENKRSLLEMWETVSAEEVEKHIYAFVKELELVEHPTVDWGKSTARELKEAIALTYRNDGQNIH